MACRVKELISHLCRRMSDFIVALEVVLANLQPVDSN